uniref:Uncharacterized protein n=1 Tax=Fagus sylvatica TaxID=28930 RepID=A0A2N9G346_FAGSY
MSQGNATRGIEIGQEFWPATSNRSEPPREEQPRVEKPITEPPRIEQPRAEQTVIEPPRVEPPQFEQPRVEAPRFEQPRVEPPRVEPPRFKQPRMEPSRVKPPQFEQPRMEPPRFKQPRMESPRMGQPQFGFPRMEPFQQGIGQLEAGFRFEPPQRPSQNRRNRFGYQNNDRQNYGRNDYDGHDRNAYNIPEREAFDRGIDLKERNIGIEPNPRLAQGQDLKDQILEVIDQALGPGHKRAPRYPYRKPYHERIDREEWPRGFKIPDFTMFSGDDEKTTIEHISRFTVQCGEYSNNGNGKLRLFPDSLTGQALTGPFTWKPRMIRPPVSEARRWVTLETLGLKPIHRQKYKYGYNPYFSRMTRTLRRRWIRQQAALHQEFERKDHYSSSLTTNSDSMEMITGAEAPEYLKGPCAKKEDTIGAPTKDIATPTMNGVGHKVQSTVAKPCRGKDLEGTRENHKRLEKGSENAESETESEEVKTSHTPMWPQKGQMVQNIGDIEDIEDIENIEDTKDMEDIENIENVEDLEGFGNIEGVENFENIEGIDDIEVEEADDIEEMEGSEAMECTETNIQTRKPKIKS